MSVKGTLLDAKVRHNRSLSRNEPDPTLVIHTESPRQPTEARAAAIATRAAAMSTKIENVRETLAECLRMGMHPTAAAAGVGIAREMLSRWLSDGRRDFDLGLQTPYARLYESLSRAQADAEQAALLNLNAAAQEPKHWMASAWFLERRFPDRWAKRTKTELTGKDGGPVQHQVAVLMVSPDKLNAAMALAEGKSVITIDAAHESADDAETVMQ